MISFSQMESLIETTTIDKDLVHCIEAIIAAENDWPESLEFFDEFILAVEEYIRGETTWKNIENFCQLSSGTNDIWKSESICMLVDAFKYGQGESLKEILTKIASTLQNP